jgi:hypothetical protein
MTTSAASSGTTVVCNGDGLPEADGEAPAAGEAAADAVGDGETLSEGVPGVTPVAPEPAARLRVREVIPCLSSAPFRAVKLFPDWDAAAMLPSPWPVKKYAFGDFPVANLSRLVVNSCSVVAVVTSGARFL